MELDTQHDAVKLPLEYFWSDASALAPDLLGKILCRKVDDRIIRARIIETEMYTATDTACHAHKGKTKRNATMFCEGGVAYVYLCYGLHNLFNIVTGSVGDPQAVLIRGVEMFPKPALLTRHLHIDRTLDGENLSGDTLWLEDDGVRLDYKTTPRIGIAYADEIDRNRLWRFVAT